MICLQFSAILAVPVVNEFKKPYVFRMIFSQEFDPVLFLPPGSYLRDFVELHEEQFPKDG